MSVIDTLSISESNKRIIQLLQEENPFIINRLGIGDETHLSFEYLSTKKINKKYLSPLCNLNGVYSKTEDLSDYQAFCIKYLESIENSTYLASFQFNSRNIVKIQNFFSKKYNIKQIHSRSLEPFYVCLDNEIPWTHFLKHKKVLILSPFVESFKKQLSNNFQIFKDKKIFLDDQQFVFYKTYQTIAGNKLHNNWLETFELMCNDIEKLDFDVALLGCGSYGLPLCNFIYSLNKSSIYIGGGLQLLFGVMGKRWEANKMWNKIIEENNTKFIRPNNNECIKNQNSIEQGCYW